MTVNNNGKNPNDLHDFLIANGCAPLSLSHNAVYDEYGEKVQEATEINIKVGPEKEQLLSDLLNQFSVD